MPPMTDDPAPERADERGDERADDEATVVEPGRVPPAPARFDETAVFTGGADGDGRASGDTPADDVEVVDLAGRYSILGPLGQGGMGTVLLAMDNRLGRKVAIKRISGEAAANRMAVARFLSEARAIAALNHPNIVQIYDYGRAVDGPFLIMEYVDGGSLLDKCAAGPIPLAEAIDLACRVCDGLVKAHEQRIIHRDIKPANVLLTGDNVPKLTDFGLAKVQADDHRRVLTSPGVVLGTADFMPPEQRRDASLVDHRSDLWSLAATVYQMVTGRSPRIIRFNDVPAGLQPVLARALEDEQDARYQSARELRDALETSLRSPGTASSTFAVAGRCPTCGVPNEAGRKFCRGCAGALEAACLSCGQPLPVREEICGACGARQTPLVEAKRVETAALQARAEGLLASLDFDRATEVAAGLRGAAHPRLGQVDAWAEGFLDAVDAARGRQTAGAAAALAAATEQERNRDFAAAALALEAVPQSLRDVALPGARETVAAALSRIDAALTEIRRLEATIKARAATPVDEGLLPDVERLFALKPDSPGLRDLRDELLMRRRQREQAWAEAVAKAADRLGHSQPGAALAILSAMPGAPTVEAQRLRAQIEQAVERARGLAAAIRDAVRAGRLDGLRELVEAYRQLEPADAEAIKLERALETRDGKLAAVDELEKASRFAEAAHVLDGITGWRIDGAVAERRRRCRRAAAERAQALAAVAAARPGASAEAIAGTAGYQRLLAATGATDAEFSAALRRIELTRAEEESRARRTRSLAIAGGMLAATVAIAAVGLGVRSSMRSAALARASQAESIAALPASVIVRFPPLVNSIGVELKLLSAGTFTMGEPHGDGAEQPQRMTLEKPFCIGVSEVTNAQWERVMGSVPSRSQAADHPVENVSWDDAVEFCKRLSALPEERKAGRTYRLPTEAEWEYACRAGTTTAYSFGDDDAALGDHGWFDGNAGNGTHPVGMKQANPWGLFDMHGNVWEWCGGGNGGDERDAARDPAAVPLRGYRGGGWSGSAAYCRSPARLSYDPASRFDFLGFRLALSPSADVLLEAAKAR